MKSLASKIGTLKRKMVDISDELDRAFMELNDAVCKQKQESSQHAQQAPTQISLKIQKRLIHLHRTHPVDLKARAEELRTLLDYVDSL